MSAQISVKLSMDAAARFRSQTPTNASSGELPELIRRLGIELLPVHPGIDDPELASYFVAQVPDRNTAEQFAARLLGCGDVEGAYYSPAAEPPSPDDTNSR